MRILLACLAGICFAWIGRGVVVSDAPLAALAFPAAVFGISILELRR